MIVASSEKNIDASQKFVLSWQELSSALGLQHSTSIGVGNYLLAQYSGNNRHYHNEQHIVAMLDGFDTLKTKFKYPLAALLAIFFHDVIYDAAKHDNEAQSAKKMKDLLSGIVDSEILAAAAYSIAATNKHIVTPNTDTNLILDLDMAILGQPWAVYERYASNVMQEYLPVYGEEAYRQGRIVLFLEPTISRGHVFLTDSFQHLNAPAIDNMQQEAEHLKSGKSFTGELAALL